MSKYVIEIEEKPLCVFDKDTQTFFPRLWRVKGFNSLVLDEEGLSRLEELNSDYINENFGELQDTAYQKGINDGSLDVKQRVEGAYQRGLNDAWEAARKIIEMASPPYWEVFNEYKEDLFGKITATEAIEKLKAYEEKQKTDEEIKVGDELEWTGDKYIVTYINYDIDTSEITDYDLLGDDGSVADHVKKCSFTKTGRHFDIASILEDMRND